MGKLDEFLGFEKDAATIIKEWKPRGCVAEKNYENSLVNQWRKIQPKSKVTPQFAVGRTKADIVIDGKIIVELKKDLKTTAQRDRLIGQLTHYKEWKGSVFVVVVGAIDPDILSEVEKFADEINSEDVLPTVLSQAKITIIKK